MGGDSEMIKNNLIRIKVAGPRDSVKISFPGNDGHRFSGDCEFRNSREKILMKERIFSSPLRIESCFSVVRGIKVGESFHWEHEEDHAFRGTLELVSSSRGITVINEIPLEYYIASVVGSEMKSRCPAEFLKVQAIVARSSAFSMSKSLHAGENFNLCADDHCQDYRGVLRETDKILSAVSHTAGKFLIYGDEIADCRFSKMCGGVTVKFQDAWGGDRAHSYMPEKWDSIEENPECKSLRHYVEGSFPGILCAPSSSDLKEFSYASEYFRWEKKIGKEEVSENLALAGHSIGRVISAVPLEVTPSFRVIKVKFKGERGECFVSGELNVRKIFSHSTLPSASFYLTDEGDNWICRGAGWGHGVGMCQIGAMNLAAKGFDHKFILRHYFPGCRILKIYESVDLSRFSWAEKRPCYEMANCYELHRCPHGDKGDGPENCRGNPSELKKES
ncbi:SpoIID/LytB domain-containing protein [candidate division WOR-3 bacterium]|nr:SpoIID/LytB domain-containing protein [candidate division WOR-3 bacterium]